MPRNVRTIVGETAERYIATQIELRAERSKFHPSCFDSDSLCRVQADIWRAGYRDAELVESVYGWSVRHASGMESFALIASARRGDVDGSLASAIAAAERWVAEDPDRRTVYVRGELPALEGR
jgi:hypothetical protein